MFDWEHRIALQAMQGKRASSLDVGEVSRFVTSYSRNRGFIFELRQDGHSKLEFVQ